MAVPSFIGITCYRRHRQLVSTSIFSRTHIMFHCHLKVYLGLSLVEDFKCLFKYVCKRSCHVIILLVGGEQRYNENGLFQDTPCVLSTDAHWKLLQLEIIYWHQIAVTLDIHLKYHNKVYFCNVHQDISEHRQKPSTMTTNWLMANSKCLTAAHTNYCSFPRYFTLLWEIQEWYDRYITCKVLNPTMWSCSGIKATQEWKKLDLS